MKINRRFDSLVYGLVPGIILPVIFVIVFWAVKYEGGGLLEFLQKFQEQKLLTKVVSLSAIPNLLLFFLFIWSNRSFSARGVIFATFLLAFLMLILKLA